MCTYRVAQNLGFTLCKQQSNMVTTEFFTLPKPRRISWSLLSFSRNEDEYPVLDRLSPENRTKVHKLIVFLQKTKRTSPSWSSFSRKRKSWCGLSFCRKQNEIPGVRGGTQKNKRGASYQTPLKMQNSSDLGHFKLKISQKCKQKNCQH